MTVVVLYMTGSVTVGGTRGMLGRPMNCRSSVTVLVYRLTGTTARRKLCTRKIRYDKCNMTVYVTNVNDAQ